MRLVMDPRHESFAQALFNKIIDCINQYIQENMEVVIEDNSLRDDIAHIAKNIYQYAEIWVDVDNILSKKNFLSTDRISLPHVNDAMVVKANFMPIIENIELILKEDKKDHDFYERISSIIVEHHIHEL
jgi:hypothetical protein